MFIIYICLTRSLVYKLFLNFYLHLFTFNIENLAPESSMPFQNRFEMIHFVILPYQQWKSCSLQWGQPASVAKRTCGCDTGRG